MSSSLDAAYEKHAIEQGLVDAQKACFKENLVPYNVPKPFPYHALNRGQESPKPTRDINVVAVQSLLEQRMNRGLTKYGITTERTDLTVKEWLQHLQDELLDASVYIQKLKGMFG